MSGGWRSVDGGEQDVGFPVCAVDEGWEVGRFSSLESVTVGGDVKFVGFGVNGEVGLFVKSWRPVRFMVQSSEVYQRAELVNETE